MPIAFGSRRRSRGAVIGLRQRLKSLVFGTLVVAGLSSVAVAAMTPEQRAAILAPTTDFSAPERFETLSGGSATNRSTSNRNAFSQPSANLSFEQRADFFVGNGLFRRNWVTAPSSTQGADGLGPLYNAPWLPGLPPQGRPRAPAGGAGRFRRVDVPAPFDPAAR